MQLGAEVRRPANTEVWFAGREMKGGRLHDYVGRNEKTRVVVHLGRKGEGRPLREMGMDSQTQQEMLAFYFKKQREQEVLTQARACADVGVQRGACISTAPSASIQWPVC